MGCNQRGNEFNPEKISLGQKIVKMTTNLVETPCLPEREGEVRQTLVISIIFCPERGDYGTSLGNSIERLLRRTLVRSYRHATNKCAESQPCQTSAPLFLHNKTRLSLRP